MIALKYQTGWKRIGAAFIDGIILALASFVISLPLLATDTEGLIISQFLLSLLPVAYSIFMHYKYGRTVGKYNMELAVIDVSETRAITLQQSFLRELVYLLAIVTDMVRAYYLMNRPGYEILSPDDILLFADYAYLLWFILEIITMLTNNKRRALHDFMAGTVVVRTDNYSNPDNIVRQLKWPGKTTSTL
jgi:uncharacterized RDD family membrane protein YckC